MSTLEFHDQILLRKAKHLLQLAGPLILGNLAWTFMGMIDLTLLGRLGPDAVAADGLALAMYTLFLLGRTGFVTRRSTAVAELRAKDAQMMP